MPQVGETKTVGGITGKWDGQTWRKVTAPPPNSNISAVDPAETSNPWLARIKGFLQGGATGLPTAAKIVQVAAPFVTGGASIPVQMAVGGGSQAIADLADTLSGDKNAPHNFGDWVARAAEGAAIPGALSGVARVAQAIKPLANRTGVGGAIGTVTGGYEGYKRGGVPGAVEGAVLGGMGGSVLGNKFSKILEGLGGEEAGAEQAFGDAYKPRVSSTVPGSQYRELPTTPAFEPQPVNAPEPPSEYGSFRPVAEASPSVEAIAPDPLARFASGPRIEKGLGDSKNLARTFTNGNAVPENLNAPISTEARPRMSSSVVEPASTANVAPPTVLSPVQSRASVQGLVPQAAEQPAWSDVEDLTPEMKKEMLDLDQAYRRHTYDQRTPYLPR